MNDVTNGVIKFDFEILGVGAEILTIETDDDLGGNTGGLGFSLQISLALIYSRDNSYAVSGEYKFQIPRVAEDQKANYSINFSLREY